MLYFAHILGRGEGCDYTIACNQKFIPLPKAKTPEEAAAFIFERYGDEMFGRESMVGSVTIYACEQAGHALDITGYVQKIQEAQDIKNAQATEVAERAQLEALQAKYGKG